jgi:predicted dehydrogenase
MATRKARWGILGVAKINGRLIPAIQKAENAELRAIASRTLSKAEVAAQAAGIPLAYASYQALLEDPLIDIVYIPLPNHLHAPWTMQAADHGKHILCEKPLTKDTAEAIKVVQHCQAKGVHLMDGFFWPHHPRTAMLREKLDQGAIGEVRRITAAFTFQLPLDPENVRLHPEMGGGSVMDVGCYPIAFANWVFQADPVRVYATAIYHQEVDVSMDAVLEYPGGRTALFDCGFTMPYRTHVEVVGTQGRITIPRMWIPELSASFHIIHDDDRVETCTANPADQTVLMVQNLSAAVLENKPPPRSPAEAISTMRVLDALQQSARTRNPVTLA